MSSFKILVAPQLRLHQASYTSYILILSFDLQMDLSPDLFKQPSLMYGFE